MAEVDNALPPMPASRGKHREAWVGLFVMGFAYQAFARFKHTDLAWPRLAWTSWGLMLAGLAGRSLLEPLVAVLVAWMRAAAVIRTDATGIKVLDHRSPDNIERGTMWCYVGDDRFVVFRYAPTGAGSGGPWEFLKDRTGYVQADAASVFDRLFNGLVAKAIEVGCWAHGRRRFVALRDTDCRVAYPLLLIGRLYRIERLATVRSSSML